MKTVWADIIDDVHKVKKGAFTDVNYGKGSRGEAMSIMYIMLSIVPIFLFLLSSFTGFMGVKPWKDDATYWGF